MNCSNSTNETTTFYFFSLLRWGGRWGLESMRVLPCKHLKSYRNGKTLLHKKSLVFSSSLPVQTVPHSHSSNPHKYTKYFHNSRLLDCHHFAKKQKKNIKKKMKVWSLVYVFSPAFATHFAGLKSGISSLLLLYFVGRAQRFLVGICTTFPFFLICHLKNTQGTSICKINRGCCMPFLPPQVSCCWGREVNFVS